jgi:hypothetical protein
MTRWRGIRGLSRQRRKAAMKNDPVLALAAVARRIFELRGQRVMLDADLAVLYGVETRYAHQD